MSHSFRNQLVDVVKRIMSGSVDEAIRFAKSIAYKLDVDALKGLARAIDIYLGDNPLMPNARRNIQAFCLHACADGAFEAFSREAGHAFA